jgi:probable blue pigment (indigoidine) exporter
MTTHGEGRGATLAITALAPMAWGTTYAVTTELLPEGRPLLAGALRALPAGVLLLAITRRLPTGEWWWKSAVLGMLNIGAFFALLFVAAQRLHGGVAATLGAIQPLIAGTLAAVLLSERLRRRLVLSGMLGVAGVSMIVLQPGARLDAVGVAAGFAGAASMATGVTLTKRWQPDVPNLVSTAWQLVAGGVALTVATLAIEGAPPELTGRNVAGYAWLSIVGAALAYALWFRGIVRLPVANVSLLGLLSPLVAVTVGWAVLHQRLGLLQVAGIAVVLTALVLGNARATQPTRLRPPASAGRSTPQVSAVTPGT